MGLNVEMYTPTSMEDETAKNIALGDTNKALLNNAGMYWLVTYFTQGQGGAVPLVTTEDNPFIKRGNIHTMYNNGDGALFEEALTHLTSNIGEPHTPPFHRSVYNGLGDGPWWIQNMSYQGSLYVPEVLVGKFKFNPMITPGTKTTKTTIQTRIIYFSKK